MANKSGSKKRKLSLSAELQPRSESPWRTELEPTTVKLEAGEIVHVTGRALMSVLTGNVWVCGKTLGETSGEVEICAVSNVAPAIAVEALFGQVAVPLSSGGGASIRLRTPAGGGPALASPGKRAKGGQSFSVYLASEEGCPPAHTYPEAWLQAAADLAAVVDAAAAGEAAPPGIAVIGTKGVGKSSFARLLVNSLLDSCSCVAYLDTDCGQPEFTVPGLLSLSLVREPLFSPPCTHLRPAAYSQFFGATSPEADHVAFCQAVASCIRWYRQQGAEAAGGRLPPLVINTHGWIKGLGLTVLGDILREAEPSHLAQIQAPSAARNLEADPAFWLADLLPQGCPLPAVRLLPAIPPPPDAKAKSDGGDAEGEGGQEAAPVPPEPERLSAQLRRSLQWLAFARAAAPGRYAAGASARWAWDAAAFSAAAAALVAEPPFAVALDDVILEAAPGAPDGARGLSETELLFAVNGSPVGLVVKGRGAEGGAGGSIEGGECAGVGIVRSVDVDRRVLYVLTPLDAEALERVDTIQVGCLDLPSSLLQSGSIESPYVSLWSISSDGSGAGAVSRHNNLVRAGQQTPGD